MPKYNCDKCNDLGYCDTGYCNCIIGTEKKLQDKAYYDETYHNCLRCKDSGLTIIDQVICNCEFSNHNDDHYDYGDDY